MLTQAELKLLIIYDELSGLVTWNKPNLYCRTRYFGDLAGNSISTNGYKQISLNGKRYRTHRAIWLYVTGLWPKDQIDHINGVKTDNRWCNLRQCTNLENQQNRKLNVNNSSGYTGVYLNKTTLKYGARIKLNAKYIFLGYFEKIKDANLAYTNAKSIHHTFQLVKRIA